MGNGMDLQAAFNVVFGLAMFAFGGLAKMLWDTVAALRTDVAVISTSVTRNAKDASETYVRRDDFKSHSDRVMTVLDRIETKLDHKADKS